MTVITATAPSGQILTVWHGVAECDKHPGHQIEFTTDGLRAYACGEVTDTGMLISRGATVFTVDCAQPDRYDEPCYGQATFNIAERDGWTVDPALIMRVTEWGEVVDL
jgi:hypothetical protein